MDPMEAYRTFNLAPGAPEAQVRAVHRDMTAAWHPDRFRNDPAMYQQAVAATQRLNAALAALQAVGFRAPMQMQPPPMQPYGQQPPMQAQPQMQVQPQMQMQQPYGQQPYAQPAQMPQQQAYPPPQQPAMYPPPHQPAGYIPNIKPAPSGRSQAGTNIVLGLVLFIVGLAITVGTRDAAESSGGGTYIVAYGPMVGGGIMFFKGLLQLGSKS